MKTRILSDELSKYVGEEVLLRGWLNAIRALGKISFVILRDRKGYIQVVVADKTEFQKVKDLQPGSILSILGKVQKSAQAELGFEIVDPDITVDVSVNEPAPVEYVKADMKADLETILDYRPITLRNEKIRSVFKIQAEIAHAYRLYMHDIVGATEYFGPGIIGASSEGGSEFFNVDYFDHKATLAQSNQLYKQMLVGVYERTFAILPFFRAENSNTVRHLTEGKQLEFEMGFFNSWTEVMDVEEGFIKFLVKHLKQNALNELKAVGTEFVSAPEDVAFPRISIKEAQQLYFERTGIDERSENDLSPAAEKELCKYAKEKFGTDLIFITDWSVAKRPFYSFPSESEPTLTNTFDLLCAGTEITSGGQRRHTYEAMVEGIKMKGMNPDDFIDYLSIFKFGMPPHGGFGIGLERLTMTILRLQNIREASLFPSDPRRVAGVRIKAKTITGSENIRNEIINRLKSNSMEFEHKVHEPTPTSEDSARVRGTKKEEGIKAIILVGKQSKQNYQFNVPAYLKLDMKKVAGIVGEKCEFEKPELIEKRYGIIIGGVPPFGNLLGMKTYFDKKIQETKRAAFNCGLQTESIVMGSSDLIKLVNPEMVECAS